MNEKKSREQAIEELTLMLLYLNRFPESGGYGSKFMEPSWKGYDFDSLEKLENQELLFQPNKSKICYLSEEGKVRARKLLEEYGLADKDLMERFEFRNIRQDEVDQAIAIEQICFPPNEACAPRAIKERVAAAPELFLVAVDKATGKIAGFLNGLSTKEYQFRDEFFTDISLYDPEGKHIMLLGLDVLPEYRKQGLAREIVYQYCRREQEKGRDMLHLTCLANKVKMYKKFGFVDRGIANSNWGGEEWHEMTCGI